MADATLVEENFSLGSDLINSLQEQGVDIRGAYWKYSSDSKRWKLNIATEIAKKGEKELFLKAIKAQTKIDLSLVQFVTPESPFYKALHSFIHVDGRKADIKNNTVNGIFIEHIIAYKIT
ncbi:MAG: hypothetical protein ACTHLA_11160 [Asticcacaulis sp.]|uniref:hypothetical protein n=1 Tax=Asticcacaulis sp. TaxID=1872648 RepID=UPI003F7B8DCB